MSRISTAPQQKGPDLSVGDVEGLGQLGEVLVDVNLLQAATVRRQTLIQRDRVALRSRGQRGQPEVTAVRTEANRRSTQSEQMSTRGHQGQSGGQPEAMVRGGVNRRSPRSEQRSNGGQSRDQLEVTEVRAAVKWRSQRSEGRTEIDLCSWKPAKARNQDV